MIKCYWCGKKFVKPVKDTPDDLVLITDTDIFGCCCEKCFKEMMKDYREYPDEYGNVENNKVV